MASILPGLGSFAEHLLTSYHEAQEFKSEKAQRAEDRAYLLSQRAEQDKRNAYQDSLMQTPEQIDQARKLSLLQGKNALDEEQYLDTPVDVKYGFPQGTTWRHLKENMTAEQWQQARVHAEQADALTAANKAGATTLQNRFAQETQPSPFAEQAVQPAPGFPSQPPMRLGQTPAPPTLGGGMSPNPMLATAPTPRYAGPTFAPTGNTGTFTPPLPSREELTRALAAAGNTKEAQQVVEPYLKFQDAQDKNDQADARLQNALALAAAKGEQARLTQDNKPTALVKLDPQLLKAASVAGQAWAGANMPTYTPTSLAQLLKFESERVQRFAKDPNNPTKEEQASIESFMGGVNTQIEKAKADALHKQALANQTTRTNAYIQSQNTRLQQAHEHLQILKSNLALQEKKITAENARTQVLAADGNTMTLSNAIKLHGEYLSSIDNTLKQMVALKPHSWREKTTDKDGNPKTVTMQAAWAPGAQDKYNALGQQLETLNESAGKSQRIIDQALPGKPPVTGGAGAGGKGGGNASPGTGTPKPGGKGPRNLPPSGVIPAHFTRPGDAAFLAPYKDKNPQKVSNALFKNNHWTRERIQANGYPAPQE